MNNYDDYVQRISTGREFIDEPASKEPRLRFIAVLIALVVLLSMAAWAFAPEAQALVEKPDQFPPGPVCPFGDANERYCL
tara:strand:+ start:8330 stop:8569 length:240 start_codon:yes stop_codon:yes gene_type:complete